MEQDVLPVFGHPVEHYLFDRYASLLQLWYAVNGIDHKMKTVEIVGYDHIERSICRARLLLTGQVRSRVKHWRVLGWQPNPES